MEWITAFPHQALCRVKFVPHILKVGLPACIQGYGVEVNEHSLGAEAPVVVLLEKLTLVVSDDAEAFNLQNMASCALRGIWDFRILEVSHGGAEASGRLNDMAPRA